jgi:hypothetical protein
MKTILAIMALTATITLTACNNQTPIQAQPNPQPPNRDEFHKKAECQKYLGKLIKERDEEADGYAVIGMVSIYRVFYSPQRDSCLVMKYALHNNLKHREQEWEEAEIDDILTGERLWDQLYKPPQKYWDIEAELDNQARAFEVQP